MSKFEIRLVENEKRIVNWLAHSKWIIWIDPIFKGDTFDYKPCSRQYLMYPFPLKSDL